MKLKTLLETFKECKHCITVNPPVARTCVNCGRTIKAKPIHYSQAAPPKRIKKGVTTHRITGGLALGEFVDALVKQRKKMLKPPEITQRQNAAREHVEKYLSIVKLARKQKRAWWDL